MGKVTGFLEIDRSDRRYEPAGDRVRHFREFMIPLGEEGDEKAGGALHGLRHPVLSHRLPGQQPDPRLERPRLQRRLARGARQPPHHQQFPRGDRPRLPGAVRGVLHAEPDRAAGDDQDDRGGDRRPRLPGGLGRARAAGDEDRQARRRDRLRPGRHGLRAAARPRRPRRASLREERQGRRPAPLRHPRLQDGEARSSTAACADGGGGRHRSTTTPMSASPSPASRCSTSTTRSC